MKTVRVLLTFLVLLVLLSLVPAEGQVRLAWTARYAGPTNAADIPVDIAADDQGNAYVTGTIIQTDPRVQLARHFTTVKFGPGGRLLWQRQYRTEGHSFARRLGRDRSGYIYVTGSSASNRFDGPQIATVKYDPDGNQIWVSRFGIDGETDPRDMVVDATGNVHVTALGNGYIPGPVEGLLSLTIKVGTDGQSLWSQQYRPTRQEVPSAVAVSPLGDICVAGWAPASNGLANFITLKYTRDGALAWERTFGSTNELSAERPFAVASDQDGSVYVTGGGTPGFVTLKYTADGTLLWSAFYQPTNTGEQYANRVAIDRDRNVIVAGTINHSSERLNWGIVKYASDGTQLWARQYNHPSGSDDGVAGMAIDNEGSIYVAGARGTNYLGLSILVTAKYSADGLELWRTEHASANPPRDLPVNLALDSSGAVYVLAESWRTNSDPDYLVLKYEQAQAAARFVDINRSGNTVNLSIFSRADATCRVDVSENMRDWAPLTNFVNTTGTIHFSDPVSGPSAQRFYRVEAIAP
jgi:hypothetical protein